MSSDIHTSAAPADNTATIGNSPTSPPPQVPPSSPLKQQQPEAVAVIRVRASNSGGSPGGSISGSSKGYSDAKVTKLLKDPKSLTAAALLKELDRNNDGKLDITEVSDLLERVVQLKQQSIYFRTMVIVQAVTLLILLGCLAGLSAAIVYFAKDTVLHGDLLVSKASGNPVLVHSADLQVTPSGVLISRDTLINNTTTLTGLGTNVPVGTVSKITSTATTSPGDTIPYTTLTATGGAVATASPGSTPASGAPSSSTPSGGRRRTLFEELMYPDEREQPGRLVGTTVADGSSGVMSQQQEPVAPLSDDAFPRAMGGSVAHRSLQQTAGAGGEGAGNTSTTAQGPVPLMTASSTVPLGLHSALPMSVLSQLKYIQVNSSSGSQLHLLVMAIAKMPAPFEEGAYSSCEVLRIVTYVGTITVHGSVLEFGEDSVHDLFKQAGFKVTGSGRRRLLGGAYGLIGFFNFIKDLEIVNLPVNEPVPHIAPIFQMKLRMFDECADPLNKTRDNCIGPDGLDKPGTVVQGGVRFMTSYQTVVRQHDVVLTSYELPNVGPDLVRKELMNETSGAVYTWQDLFQGTRAVHCEYTDLNAPENDIFKSISKDAIVDFRFLGYEMKLGVPTRHFRLTTKQPVFVDGLANATAAPPPAGGSSNNLSSAAGPLMEIKLVEMDFWDTSDNGDLCSIARNNYPVAFEMVHPLAGISKMHVVSFTASVSQPNAVFALPKAFNDTNNPRGCPGARFTKVPAMVSPFGDGWNPPPREKIDSLFTFENIVVEDDESGALQTLVASLNLTAAPYTSNGGSPAGARRRASASHTSAAASSGFAHPTDPTHEPDADETSGWPWSTSFDGSDTSPQDFPSGGDELLIPIGDFIGLVEHIFRIGGEDGSQYDNRWEKHGGAVEGIDGRLDEDGATATSPLSSLLTSNGVVRKSHGGRSLQSHSYSINLGVCSGSYITDAKHTASTYNLKCGGPIPQLPLVELNGEVYVKVSRSMFGGLSCSVSGCVNVGLGVTEMFKKLKLPGMVEFMNKYNIYASVTLASICASYDSSKKVAALTGTTKLPNVGIAWAQWTVRLETNFKDCVSLTSAKVVGNYKSWCGLSFCTKSAFDINLHQGSGCSSGISQ